MDNIASTTIYTRNHTRSSQAGTMTSALPLLETAPLLKSLLEERGFAAFVYGFGVALFTAVAAGAGFAANAICTTSIITAVFGKFKIILTEFGL